MRTPQQHTLFLHGFSMIHDLGESGGGRSTSRVASLEAGNELREEVASVGRRDRLRHLGALFRSGWQRTFHLLPSLNFAKVLQRQLPKFKHHVHLCPSCQKPSTPEQA